MAQTRTSPLEGSPAPRRRQPTSSQEPPDFDAIYRRYRPDLVRFARRRGAEDPEGVADLALLDLARAFPRLRSTEAPVLQAYLYKATRNRTARERAASAGTVLGLDEIEDVPSGAFEEMVARGLDVDSLLSTLSQNQEESLRLRFFQQLTSAEAAQVMGVDAVTVRTHQRRGLTQLRHLILAGLVAAAIVAGLVAVFRGTGTDVIFSEPISPDEAPPTSGQPVDVEDSGRPATPEQVAPRASSSTVAPPSFSIDAPAPAEPAPTTTIPELPDIASSLSTTTTIAELPAAAPAPSTTTFIPELPAPDDPPELPGASTTTFIPELPPPDDPPELPGADSSPSATTIPVLPGYDG